jgi:hypothetical protein
MSVPSTLVILLLVANPQQLIVKMEILALSILALVLQQVVPTQLNLATNAFMVQLELKVQ